VAGWLLEKIEKKYCNACNQGLGHFKDNHDNLLKAIEYLNKNKIMIKIA